MKRCRALLAFVALMLVDAEETVVLIEPAADPSAQVVSPDCAAVVLSGAGILGAVTAGATFSLVLEIVGFTATGVAPGSFAAWWQSTMPLVAAGSLFARLQAFAMGGGGAAASTLGAIAGDVTAFNSGFMANVCKWVDEEVSKGSAAGDAIQANTHAVQTILSSEDGVKYTAKEVFDAAPPAVKDAAANIGEAVKQAADATADAAGKAADAASKAADTAGKTAAEAADKVKESAEAAEPIVEDKLKDVAEATRHFFDGLPRWL